MFLKWKRKYGKIFTYWVGELPIVSVSDYDLAVKLFVKEGGKSK
jgi:cytochrome P450 family 35